MQCTTWSYICVSILAEVPLLAMPNLSNQQEVVKDEYVLSVFFLAASGLQYAVKPFFLNIASDSTWSARTRP